MTTWRSDRHETHPVDRKKVSEICQDAWKNSWRLTEWERGFMTVIRDYHLERTSGPTVHLTAKQEEALNRIEEKIYHAG